MNKIFLKGLVEKLAENKYQITASTSAIDRQGDSIDQTGWDLTNFKANPVLLWAHDYSEFPIGKVTSIAVVNGALKAEFEFAPESANPKAEQVRQLYEGGYVNASSVGLIPLTREGNIIKTAELLELSLVPVPANQEALRMAVANKSLDVSLIEKDLEKGAVAQQVNIEEMWEAKYEKYDEVYEVLSALWTVYFDQETPVEDFSKLLTEAITLLQGVAANDGADDDAEKGIVAKAITPENIVKFTEAMLQKSGKRLSKKTIGKIDSSIESMKSSITLLEDLKKEDDQSDSTSEVATDEETKKVESKKEDVIEIPLSEFMKTFQGHLRSADKSLEQANTIVNDFMSHRKS